MRRSKQFSRPIADSLAQDRRRYVAESLEPRLLLASYQYDTISSFVPAPLGALPFSTLATGPGGNFYGTTSGGGANNDGTVFEVLAGTYTVKTVASFNGTNGANPYTGVTLDSRGDIFGTTRTGGAYGFGDTFEISAGTSTITSLASFTQSSTYYSGVVVDSKDNLFGTTQYGGTSSLGSIFEVAAGSGTITTLASFIGSNGSEPFAGLTVDPSGDIFGTTSGIGIAGADGTVFEVGAGSSTITILATFNSTTGAVPESGVTLDSTGDVFGTTHSGGASQYGTVFEIAARSGAITTLASFPGVTGSTQAVVSLDSSGDLFGTTPGGGNINDGTVFEIAAGSKTVSVLASFDQNVGRVPMGGVTLDPAGDLLGTAELGGPGNNGMVFMLANGTGAITSLASFANTSP